MVICWSCWQERGRGTGAPPGGRGEGAWPGQASSEADDDEFVDEELGEEGSGEEVDEEAGEETGDEEADDEDRTDGEDGGGHSSNCLLRSLHRIMLLSLKMLNFNGHGKWKKV